MVGSSPRTLSHFAPTDMFHVGTLISHRTKESPKSRPLEHILIVGIGLRATAEGVGVAIEL